MSPTKSLRLDGYIRVSDTRGREDTLISDKLQAEKLEDYGRLRGHTVTVHKAELDISGGKMNRPILDSIIERIRTGQTDGIIISKINRFARTLVGGLLVLEEIDKAGGVFVAVEQDIDMSTRSGKLMGHIFLVLAEDELDRIREEWSDAQKHAVKDGIYTTSTIPPGYDIEPTERQAPRKNRKRPSGRLIPNADAPTIKLAFQMRGSGTPYAEIRDLLNDKMPKPNGFEWNGTTVARLFAARIYRGEMIRGDMVNPDACEPIVTEAEWQAAQRLSKRTVARTKRVNLLRGLIRCAECGHTLTPTVSGSGKNQVHIYRCRGDHVSGRCAKPARIKRDDADAYVQSAFLEQLANVELSGSTTNAELDAVTGELSELESELAEFAGDTSVRNALGAERYRTAIETRTEAIEAVRSRLRALSGQASVDTPTAATYADLSIEDRHAILSGAVDVILCRGGVSDGSTYDRMRIFWRGEAETDLAYPCASW